MFLQGPLGSSRPVRLLLPIKRFWQHHRSPMTKNKKAAGITGCFFYLAGSSLLILFLGITVFVGLYLFIIGLHLGAAVLVGLYFYIVGLHF